MDKFKEMIKIFFYPLLHPIEAFNSLWPKPPKPKDPWKK